MNRHTRSTPTAAEFMNAEVHTLDPNLSLEEIIDSLLRWKVSSAPCLLYTSPSPRDLSTSRMPSSA